MDFCIQNCSPSLRHRASAARRPRVREGDGAAMPQAIDAWILRRGSCRKALTSTNTRPRRQRTFGLLLLDDPERRALVARAHRTRPRASPAVARNNLGLRGTHECIAGN